MVFVCCSAETACAFYLVGILLLEELHVGAAHPLTSALSMLTARGK